MILPTELTEITGTRPPPHRITIDGVGAYGKDIDVYMDGELLRNVLAVEFRASVHGLAEVTLTLLAESDIDVEAVTHLDEPLSLYGV